MAAPKTDLGRSSDLEVTESGVPAKDVPETPPRREDPPRYLLKAVLNHSELTLLDLSVGEAQLSLH